MNYFLICFYVIFIGMKFFINNKLLNHALASSFYLILVYNSEYL